MKNRLTVTLTAEQTKIVNQLAKARSLPPPVILLQAIAHGLAMIVAGVDYSDLEDPDPPDSMFEPVFPDPPRQKRRRKAATDDDIPF
ncbi:hypothetical protein ACX4M5_01975 [Roseomonas mucosa]|uniref:hypothetical protein n=1 Tax=Roseomonas mucosa TaxID=207340 RepID=UPI001EF41555|nr:hypothetical protein [Roseomonas mucosa]MCG7354129.1 hypothetical protein [Roseomonas mucosa]MDT8292064.1 hypothetical protein [Roseomonas mucosa]